MAAEERASSRRAAGAQSAITVEIADAARFGALGQDWRGLIHRAAAPNVSMHPAVALAAQASGRPVHVVLAWLEEPAAPTRLVGVWVFAVGPLSRRLPVRVLLSPAHPQMVLGGPVLDREVAAEALAAMLDALAAARALPKIISATEFSADDQVAEVLHEILADRRAPAQVLRRLTRTKLEPGLDGSSYLERALPAKKRREQGRHRRRLSELGRLEVTSHRMPDEACAAFEEFLTLEASGWKGRAGSALSQRGGGTPEFVRAAVAGLAQEGLVDVMMLRLDGRAVASQVLLWCGDVAHTWKCAYDEELRSCGPGLLMVEDVTRALLAEPNLRHADSSTNMEMEDIKAFSTFWTERLEVANLLIDVRRGGSVGFRLLALKEQLSRVRRSLGLGRRGRAPAPKPALLTAEGGAEVVGG
jgi:CelD/BcsL family acetyltransferase involved in cellulose biosynthesis